MTARPDLPSGSSASAPALATDPQPTLGTPARLRAAIGLSLIGAALTGLGPLLGLTSPAVPAAYPAWPLLLVLALLAPVAAAVFARRGRPVVAAALLVGPAAFAPGRLGQDVQFAADAGMAARPELLRATSLLNFEPGVGWWLLAAGHVLALVAGVLATWGTRESGDGSHRQGLLAMALCAGVLGAVAVLMAPFSSDDPYLPAETALDGPLPVLIGSALLAVAVPCAAGLLAGSTDAEFARGGLLGVAFSLIAVAVPPLVSVLVLDELSFAWGPLLGLLAAAALLVLAVRAGRGEPAEDVDDLRLPALTRLLTLAGVFALLAGAVAVLAALTPHVAMPYGLRDPSEYPARMLVPAGILLVVVGAGMLLPKLALPLRPVLTVLWAVVPLAAAGSLDAVFTAVQAAGAGAGLGAWAAGLSVLLAAVSAVLAALAGAVERDDVDLTEMAMRRLVLIPSLVALVLGAGAFSLPVLTAPDYSAPGVFTDFGTTSWGLVLALAAVVGATALAPMCRPGPAAALLFGAALLVAVRALEFPLTAGRLTGAAPGLGLWCAIGCAVVLLGTALAARTTAEPSN
ncbi:hypothetical protein QFW96_09870 [Saccharopolyspora sp. TS4A08]|uniref:Uncharacterized protein n=1 Tax=Saccharopolyspora ipomoeae TaxID=3042027 RepID=A0ABT6PLN9_9PSEU|nr:hypothetical protein [Saccharopolyspora sp. TS4A08]MDI2028919.1 hypothetical protein [Saccharopolyspora sp. TS4A08]